MIEALESALRFGLRIPVCGVLGSGVRRQWVGKETNMRKTRGLQSSGSTRGHCHDRWATNDIYRDKHDGLGESRQPPKQLETGSCIKIASFA